jgi:hypothetical protein
LKGNIGSGLYAMGDAFRNAGLIAGPVISLLLAVICVYCQHMLVSTHYHVPQRGLVRRVHMQETGYRVQKAREMFRILTGYKKEIYRMFQKYAVPLLGRVLCTKTTKTVCVSMGSRTLRL